MHARAVGLDGFGFEVDAEVAGIDDRLRMGPGAAHDGVDARWRYRLQSAIYACQSLLCRAGSRSARRSGTGQTPGDYLIQIIMGACLTKSKGLRPRNPVASRAAT